jgi:hypothetical protein
MAATSDGAPGTSPAISSDSPIATPADTAPASAAKRVAAAGFIVGDGRTSSIRSRVAYGCSTPPT